MVNLSLFEFSLVLNGFLLLSFVFSGFAFNNLMCLNRLDDVSRCFTVVLLFLAFEQFIGAYWFDHAFFLTSEGYIATNSPVLLSVKPLLYVMYLVMAYLALFNLFEKYQIVCSVPKLLTSLFFILFFVSLSFCFTVLWVKTVCAIASAVFLYLFIANVSKPIDSSVTVDFLVKSPLRRLRISLIGSWGFYIFFFACLHQFGLELNFPVYYLIFIFVDAGIKLIPFYFIYQSYKSSSV